MEVIAPVLKLIAVLAFVLLCLLANKRLNDLEDKVDDIKDVLNDVWSPDDGR